LFQRRAAGFAEVVAALLDADVPLPEALETAADAWNGASLIEATRTLAASLKQGQTPSDEGRLAQRFPPLLRYALWHSEAITGRPRALRMAAGVYRRSSDEHVQRLRTLAPFVTCVIIGGGVTLLYGMALFTPYVDLLRGLAASH